MGSAYPYFRRRKALCLTLAPAPRMWAARSCAVCSRIVWTKGDFDVADWQKAGGHSQRRDRLGEWPGDCGERTEGRAQARPGRRYHRQTRGWWRRGLDARGHAECPRHVGYVADADLEP